MRRFALLPVLWLASCTVNPFLRTPDGAVVSLGGSVFSRSDEESGGYEGPHGKLWYGSKKKDETVVPVRGIGAYQNLGIANTLYKGFKAGEATKVKLGEQSVSKHATTKAAEVETTKILNPVEEPLPAVIPPVAQ